MGPYNWIKNLSMQSANPVQTSPLDSVMNAIESNTPGNTGINAAFDRIGGLEGLSTISKGIASLGQIYGSMQQANLAREQLKFSKRAYQTNLDNQRRSYNTSLEGRARSRIAYEGGSAADVDRYLSKHKL